MEFEWLEEIEVEEAEFQYFNCIGGITQSQVDYKNIGCFNTSTVSVELEENA